MFRLKCEVNGYLGFEVFGASIQDCIDKFKAQAKVEEKRRSADWTAEIEKIVDAATYKPETCIDDLTFGGVFVDFERVA
ncbi:hypothetical protein BAJUN_00550 [Bajunvirus bajun]|uniref:Uncharacterized protein n=1 Tax=Brevundimonas phage vB_BgoS-Bajun TaxID=2948594 RepID=A0A9E7N5Y6_9CAUD|nr:hypothetical protein BAJUN_00550 [Brevundimonas phage vB_BgoS-Bajun]